MNRTPMSQSYVNSKAGQQQQQGVGGGQTAGASSSLASTTSNPQSSSAAAAANPAASSDAAAASQTAPNSAMPGTQMQQLMCATELTNLLLEFAFSVFVTKPADVVEYAASYFNALHRQQQQQPLQQQQKRSSSDSQRSANSAASQCSSSMQLIGAAAAAAAVAASESQQQSDHQHQHASLLADNSEQLSMDEDYDATSIATTAAAAASSSAARKVNFAEHQQQQQQMQLQQQYIRRKSVFAEQYDPANDNDDDENSKVVHSKTDEQRMRLAKAIQSIFIFRSVDAADMADILDAMFEVKVKCGDCVIKQGDDGDNFYVVERGKFQIYVERDDGSRDVRGECVDSGSFGELALMYNQPRAATVVALSDGSLWAMDRNTFRKIVLKGAYKKRKNYEALFEKVSVLQGLNGYERMNLCDALVSQRFAHGQKIIEQGDIANGMYFIESGQVKIVKRLEDGQVRELAVLGKGDYFGELALIEHKPRAASVFAIGDDVKLAFLDVKAFERLLGSCIDRMEKNCAMYFSELAHREGRQNV